MEITRRKFGLMLTAITGCLCAGIRKLPEFLRHKIYYPGRFRKLDRYEIRKQSRWLG